MIKVQVRNVSKKFNVDFRRNEGTLARLVKFLKGKKEKKERIALQNVSFSASAGEVVGIIGKNGTGKSTLLKLIAGIYQPTEGKIITHGNLVYITSSGLGFLPKLTMRENIYLAGSIMDLAPAEIKQRFGQIVDFSGLHEFVDTKVYQFSTGMAARLNFSTAFYCIKHKNPDILLIDEVFGTGADIDFEKKAAEKMEELIKGGATVVMASHNLEIIEKYCPKVLWLDKGMVADIGEPQKVVSKYLSS